MSSLTVKDLNNVYTTTYAARNKWSNIMLSLNMSYDMIESIRKRQHNESEDCYLSGLYEWLKSGEGNWKDLAEAVSSEIVGHEDIARSIEKKYINQGSTEDTTSDRGGKVQTVNDNLVIFTNENIGNGAYGAVYKGKFKGKPCALKMLHLFVTQIQHNLPVGQGEEEVCSALARECNHLQSFKHENVVQHISTEKHSSSNNIILVTELMDCNLRAYFARPEGKSLTTLGDVSLSKDVAAGLAYIHSRHVIHRDLCGENVLLQLRQPVPIAKISDFGMSKLIDPSKCSASLTALHSRKEYLPPEAKEGRYDQSLDNYSLGIVILQIVSKLDTVQTTKDRPIQLYIAKIQNERLKPLIEACLQENPRNRPSSNYMASVLETEVQTLRRGITPAEQKPLPIPCFTDKANADEMITLYCTAEYNSYSLKKQTCWAIASISAPFYEPTMRASVDIVAVIDKSGSMAGRKLKLVRDSLKFLIDQLRSNDRLSVVTYDSDVTVDFELMSMTEANKINARSLVASITDGSYTNLCGGLIKGLELITSNSGRQNLVQSVLLFTDGVANVGIVDTAEILREVEKYQKKLDCDKTLTIHQPMEVSQDLSNAKFEGTIYTFGFGAEHNFTLLENLSTQGGGIYCYIDTKRKIPESIAACLGGLLSVVGQNLLLELELQNDNCIKVHDSRIITWTTQKNCEIGMGDLQSEEERDIVLELQLPAMHTPQQNLVLKASLSYFNVITSAMITVTCDLTVNRKVKCSGCANEVVDLHRNRIHASEALKKSSQLVDQERHVEAKSVLQEAIFSLHKSPSREHKVIKCLLSDLNQGISEIDVAEDNISTPAFLSCKAQSHFNQKSSSDPFESAYFTPVASSISDDFCMRTPKETPELEASSDSESDVSETDLLSLTQRLECLSASALAKTEHLSVKSDTTLAASALAKTEHLSVKSDTTLVASSSQKSNIATSQKSCVLQ